MASQTHVFIKPTCQMVKPLTPELHKVLAGFEQKLDGYLNFWIPSGLNLQIFLNFSLLVTSATTHLYILKCLTLAEAGVK
jgi:hypothetical protein